jgi:hypothetical protein
MVFVKEPIKILLATWRLGILQGGRDGDWFQIVHLNRLKINPQLIILLEELLVYGLSLQKL